MNPLLTLDNVTMRFGGLTANHQVSFTVQKGHISALIGPNGAGKTTLFNCITGFYQASDGDIVLHGDQGNQSIRALVARPIVGGSYLVARAGIARTFQNIRLFRELSVLENLLVAQHRSTVNNLFFGLFNLPGFRRAEQAAIERAYDWLEHMGLADDGNRLAGQLPYGKQRRLEIARCLCTQPRLLCLDEPAAGLNPSETADLAETIQKLRNDHGISIMVIEHDMHLVMSIADHIVVLDHGTVIADGTPEDIAAHPKVIAAYLGDDDE